MVRFGEVGLGALCCSHKIGEPSRILVLPFHLEIIDRKVIRLSEVTKVALLPRAENLKQIIEYGVE
jgi:hypothetical protein